MPNPFDYFVILAAKRTGSNLLEAGVNQIDGLKCHGELFNPGFVGKEGQQEYLGVDISSRFRRPERLLDRLLAHDADRLHGFRLFAEHDHRITERILEDRRCAKIILRRRPLASYLSTLQAEETGQWRVEKKGTQQVVKVHFDPDHFEQYAAETESWYRQLEEKIRLAGQSFFPIRYEECKDPNILNGIASYLGVDSRLERVEERTLRQNPVSLAERIDNFAEFSRYLERSGYVETVERVPERDVYLLNGSNFFVSKHSDALLFDVPALMPDRLKRAFLPDDPTQIRGYPALIKWSRSVERPQTAAYVVHPVERAYAVFNKVIYLNKRQEAAGIHNYVEEHQGTTLATSQEVKDGVPYSAGRHKANFLIFLSFLEANLEGHTGIQRRRMWMPQAGFMSAIARVLPGIRPVRQGMLSQDMAAFEHVTLNNVPDAVSEPFALPEIYDEEVESAVERIYPSDYRNFGFGAWSGKLRGL